MTPDPIGGADVMGSIGSFELIAREAMYGTYDFYVAVRRSVEARHYQVAISDHPAGDRMYGANRGLSPADIERYDVSSGPAVYAYDSPYHGDHAMCGDLWFTEDGARILTACGNAFRASNVLSTQAVSTSVVDVVFADNGYVYAFPARDQWENVYSLELMTGAETTSTGQIYAGTVGRLHPSGDRLYGANRGLSPSDLERYDIGAGTAQLSYDSPYHGDYAVCGDLWFSEDGARIFTACGNVFRASNVREDDMTYNGVLEGMPSVTYVEHSAAAGLVAAATQPQAWVPSGTAPTAGRVVVFEDEFLQPTATIELAALVLDGMSSESSPRFVFFNASGTTLHIVTRSEPLPPATARSTLVSVSVSSL